MQNRGSCFSPLKSTLDFALLLVRILKACSAKLRRTGYLSLSKRPFLYVFQFGELNITNSDEIHIFSRFDSTLARTNIGSPIHPVIVREHAHLGWSTVFQIGGRGTVMLMEPKRP